MAKNNPQSAGGDDVVDLKKRIEELEAALTRGKPKKKKARQAARRRKA